jgi:hypothetical protein
MRWVSFAECFNTSVWIRMVWFDWFNTHNVQHRQAEECVRPLRFWYEWWRHQNRASRQFMGNEKWNANLKLSCTQNAA